MKKQVKELTDKLIWPGMTTYFFFFFFKVCVHFLQRKLFVYSRVYVPKSIL